MSLGQALRKRRKALGLTLQEIARRVETDGGNLSRIERGAQGVSETMLRRLCAALECTPAFLYTHAETAPGNAAQPGLHLNRLESQEFVRWFRSVAPYIHAFGERTFVIAFGGEVVEEGQFVALAHDINLLASLEVRLVLVHGARPQIESRLKRARLESKVHAGLRITDQPTMEAVKEANGAIRVEIEALLSMGLINSPMAGSDIRVASGNFVTARPLGIRDGVDLQHTGEVRKIDAQGIRKRLDDSELVLLSPLGYSPTGEAFNLTLEDVATQAAIALDADKLVFLMDSTGVHNLRGELLREMTVEKARNLLRHTQDENAAHITEDVRYYLPAAVHACDHGVTRTHLICRHTDGAILQELFTHEGIGTMVTEMPLESIRRAEIGDVGGILQLIEPLENEGILVRRNRERLEMEIAHFCVMEHDGVIIGCAALYPFEQENCAELACMAIHPAFRRSGRGDRLLHHIETVAQEQGIHTLFVLTTRTAHWFIERGFGEADVAVLPPVRQQLYNYRRRSKVFTKTLTRTL